ncbi:hypothetical protein ACA910_003849 [Epithemia clementina (nom. ined.)]
MHKERGGQCRAFLKILCLCSALGSSCMSDGFLLACAKRYSNGKTASTGVGTSAFFRSPSACGGVARTSRLRVVVDSVRGQQNNSRTPATKNTKRFDQVVASGRSDSNVNNPYRQAGRWKGARGQLCSAKEAEDYAEAIENQLVALTDSLRSLLSKNNTEMLLQQQHILFPTVRECNEALAAFGDAGDLLRALRLFGKMRKLKHLKEDLKQRIGQNSITLPEPSLVTYSTLMSRAVNLSKPRVALRLWNLMCPTIAPDVKAANILMNCFAKMADVKRAKQLLREMKTGSGVMINHRLTPNLITINTLLNACQRAGDLDAALEVQMELEELGIFPDARTYTTLIATVAREASQHAGKNDPSLAFVLLDEMTEKGIRPNGMTYSALIGACSRCRRSDLALQGLRMMMRQKAQEQDLLKKQQSKLAGRRIILSKNNYTLPNEVGAWTAAIDACGKADRIETATKLFYAMPNFGCEPNTITCGSLTDSLLRAGRTAETLEVLRYMKRKDIAPSEVMYTSLMTRANRLVQMENNYTDWAVRSMMSMDDDKDVGGHVNETSGTKAIEVYTELMLSLIATKSTKQQRPTKSGGKGHPRAPDQASSDQWENRDTRKENNSAILVKVFLVFQQMKASGAVPDIACYNAILKACARAGEFDHAMRIMNEILSHDDLEPNDNSWRELLKAASYLRRSDLAVQVWRQGLTYQAHTPMGKSKGQSKTNATSGHAKGRSISDNNNNGWVPSIASFAEFLSAFLRESELTTDPQKRMELLISVVQYYCKILLYNTNIMNAEEGDNDSDGMHLIDRTRLLNSRHTLLLILRAAVALRDMYGATTRQGQKMETLSTSIIQLETFNNKITPQQRLSQSSIQALDKARSWLEPPRQQKRRAQYQTRRT